MRIYEYTRINSVNKNRGQILIHSLLLSAIGVVFIVVLVNVASFSLGEINRSFYSEQAFQIAEAGIEYYRWHLAHDPTDFKNGTGQPGPYYIPYKDKEGNDIGTIVLDITAPPIGSTLVKIKSTGIVNVSSSSRRTIEAQLAIPSVAKYATAVNDKVRFGAGTVVNGQIHSNDGIRFDGVANNIVTSAKSEYDDPDHSGVNEFGVHTHVSPVDPYPPSAVPTRTDVFKAGRQFPVPAIDFNNFTADLAQIKTDAQANGRYFAPSSGFGYEIILKTDDTFDIYTVNSLEPPPSSSCYNVVGEDDWGTWSVKSKTLISNYAIPANGLIFIEDDVWVSGQINTARVTIASGKFPENPSTDTHITVNGDLLYTNYDGQDVIGLIAQKNFNVGLFGEDDLKIDAAIIAKNGRVGRYYYRQPWWNYTRCGPNSLRDTITLYGMIATNKRYGFSWGCGGYYCSGYNNRNINYDSNLLYGPPPSFPLTSSDYETISWEEIR